MIAQGAELKTGYRATGPQTENPFHFRPLAFAKQKRGRGWDNKLEVDMPESHLDPPANGKQSVRNFWTY